MARFLSTSVNTDTLTTRQSTVKYYCVAGSNTWTVPPGITCATFELWGPGGAGGARCCCDCYHQGAGGTGGGFAAMSLAVTPGTVYTLNIGQGGANDATNQTCVHSACLGPGGNSKTYVTGSGITYLCAHPGTGGNNMCYMYCQCAYCCDAWVAHDSCALGANADINTSTGAMTAASFCTGGAATATRSSHGSVGVYSDSQMQYYASYTGGTAFTGGRIVPQNHCTSSYSTCPLQATWFGKGGDGSGSHTCCNCMPAGTGSNGVIIIRY